MNHVQYQDLHLISYQEAWDLQESLLKAKGMAPLAEPAAPLPVAKVAARPAAKPKAEPKPATKEAASAAQQKVKTEKPKQPTAQAGRMPNQSRPTESSVRTWHPIVAHGFRKRPR